MQGGGTLARNTGPPQWAKPALIQHWRHKSRVGELNGMARDPLAGHGFELRRRWLGLFVQAAVAFHLAHLLAHSCSEQRVLIGKRDADAIALFDFAAPGDIARITGAGTQGRDAQINGCALAQGTRAIAGDAAQADSVQALPGNGRGGTLDQLDSDIIRVR